VALRQADLKERLAGLAVESGSGSRAEFGDYVRREVAKYEKLVKQPGIRSE
jgi:tripartite-type tricarboxylate transporter receptor subunit TctC